VGEKIRVLIVDDIAETRENIRKLLQFEPDVEVVGAARTGREAIDIAIETQPDVVLMDINMPDMDGITATEAIRRKVPFAQIVILSVQSDPNYMRRAMLAGARDFLTKPPMVDELTAAIRRAGEMAHQERSKTAIAYPTGQGSAGVAPFTGGLAPLGRVITVYSPKGGVGTTAIASNLAMLLHGEENPALLVDADLQFGDVAVFLNKHPRNSIVDLAPRASELDAEVVEEVLLTYDRPEVKVLCAPLRPEEAEGVTGEQIGQVIQYLKRLYTYVIVDTASDLYEITLAALDQADVILLVTTQDIPSIKNARLMLGLLDQLGVPRERLIFTLNRYNSKVGITPEKLGESLKQPVEVVLPEDSNVATAVNRGIPLVTQGKKFPFVRGMLKLKEVVRQRLSQIEEEEIRQRSGAV